MRHPGLYTPILARSLEGDVVVAVLLGLRRSLFDPVMHVEIVTPVICVPTAFVTVLTARGVDRGEGWGRGVARQRVGGRQET